MSALLSDPTHWLSRAREARALVQQLESPQARAAILKIAAEYDRIAVRAAEREASYPSTRARR